MDHDRKYPPTNEPMQKCKCGWVGHRHQLAIWLRQDTVVSKICPACGSCVEQRRAQTFRVVKSNTPEPVLH